MNSHDTSILTPKHLAAGVAVVIALTGVATELEWLTVIALVAWVAAMLYFGRGDRKQH